MKVSVVFVLIVSAIIGLTHGSAIPVWEFLRKDEKTSFLYSIFAKDVEKLCASASSSNCFKDNLKYGLDKLKKLSEEELDLLDPYQRDGNNLLWTTLMEGHELSDRTPEPKPSTTAKPNSYDDQSFDELEFGASAKIDDVQKVSPPAGFIYRPGPANQFEKQHNALSISYYDTTKDAEDLDAINYPQIPLIGPMVVRVHPDGTPVEEVQRIPQDDDLRQYQLTKIKLPDF